MHFTSNTETALTEVRSFVMGERKSCLSDREWKFRLKGYGYRLRDTERGTMLMTHPQGADICMLDL